VAQLSDKLGNPRTTDRRSPTLATRGADRGEKVLLVLVGLGDGPWLAIQCHRRSFAVDASLVRISHGDLAWVVVVSPGGCVIARSERLAPKNRSARLIVTPP
jgi:hypothetical protein